MFWFDFGIVGFENYIVLLIIIGGFFGDVIVLVMFWNLVVFGVGFVGLKVIMLFVIVYVLIYFWIWYVSFVMWLLLFILMLFLEVWFLVIYGVIVDFGWVNML